MRFHVGPWRYRVQISTGPLMQGNVECAGLFIPSRYLILLSGTMPPRRRMAALLHELKHAWQRELGRPASDEDDCNQSASFTYSVWQQLMAQGGEEALINLPPAGDQFGVAAFVGAVD